MIDLKDCTFMIPIRLESDDRKKNFKTTLSYLCKHLDTNIIILESSLSSEADSIIKEIEQLEFTKSKINYLFIKDEDEIFHRTKFLNIMLSTVKTKVVVNYDADVLLEPKIYLDSYNQITNGADLVFPYYLGDSQYKINNTGRYKIATTNSVTDLQEHDASRDMSQYGHCQFFNTRSYIDGGMEQEKFKSYGPEDQERAYRFQKLGYNVKWGAGFIFHLEHSRGINSGTSNPEFEKNNELFKYIKSLSAEQLKEYYENQDYATKYRK